MDKIFIKNVKKEEKNTLWNMIQKYLYEMTSYYEDVMGTDGNYTYRFFDAYFENEPGREAFFFCRENTVIGFAMINTHSFDDTKTDYCLAEFTVFPLYRGNGTAEESLKLLLSIRPGKWQLKYSTANVRGMRFWQKVLLPYNPKEKELEGRERLVNFSVN